MEIGILLAVLAVLALVGAIIAHVAPRLKRDDTQELAWLIYEQLADEVGGLSVVRTDEGWPRLKGLVDGVEVEIDHTNDIAYGLDGMLGLRCRIDEAVPAPNGAIWVGEIPALHTQYGRPRPLGDPDGLFEVYTRAASSASDWWNEPELLETLRALPGGGVLLYEGQLTVVFGDLDAESVRAAMRVPSLIRDGVQRVTIH